MKITTIELPIYELDIVIIIEPHWVDINKKYKLELDNEELDAHALTVPNPVYKGRFEIFLLLKPEYLDNNTLLHEIYHLVSWICMTKGITPDPENDEALAYLQGYLGEKVLEFRDKYLTKLLEIPK